MAAYPFGRGIKLPHIVPAGPAGDALRLAGMPAARAGGAAIASIHGAEDPVTTSGGTEYDSPRLSSSTPPRPAARSP